MPSSPRKRPRRLGASRKLSPVKTSHDAQKGNALGHQPGKPVRPGQRRAVPDDHRFELNAAATGTVRHRVRSARTAHPRERTTTCGCERSVPSAVLRSPAGPSQRAATQGVEGRWHPDQTAPGISLSTASVRCPRRTPAHDRPPPDQLNHATRRCSHNVEIVGRQKDGE